MSQSPLTNEIDENEQPHDPYLENWNKLATLIRGGRSLSGRERNCCFLNHGAIPPNEQQFSDVSAAVGLDLIDDGRGLAVVDWDHDGDLDLWLANRTGPRIRFMRNQLAENTNFISLQLQGTTANRDAIGARVELLSHGDDARQIETVRAGEGFLSQSSKRVHFGLGENESPRTVRVRWPGSSKIQEFPELKANRRYRLVQGAEQPYLFPKRNPITLEPGELTAPPTNDATRVVLSQRRNLPKLNLISFTGEQQPLSSIGSQPTLINLWASWCQPCIEELQQLAKQAQEYKAQGLEIVAISVDEDVAAATQVYERLELPFTGGMAPNSTVEQLTQIDREIFYRFQNLPLPCSFLVDQSGKVAVVYKGPVSGDQLQSDIDSLQGSLTQMVQTGQPFPGQSIAAWFSPDPVNIARAYWEGGYADEAIDALTDPVQKPTSTQEKLRALQLLATIAKSKNMPALHQSSLQQLVRLQPNGFAARIQLALSYHREGRAKELSAQIDHLERSAADHAQLLRMLGPFYISLGQPEQGLKRLKQAQRLSPNDAEIQMSVALAYQISAEINLAIKQYEEILQNHPHRLDAANNLAWLLATDPSTAARRSEAVALAKETCRQTQDRHPAFLDTLAMALANSGDQAAAVDVLRRAIPVAQGRGEIDLARKMRDRLTSYQ
ncbi:MAG: ASPIC/UnbV domain-containing protein [Pirellulaceae bacterium]|nr:ASPIC/UnbV domain-containing protein [Pirellulaceae bacterium]